MREKDKLTQLVEWAFLGLLSYFAWNLTVNVDKMRESIGTLNTNVAVLVERTLIHDQRIKALETAQDKRTAHSR